MEKKLKEGIGEISKQDRNNVKKNKDVWKKKRKIKYIKKERKELI